MNRAIEEVLRFEGPIKILIRWVVQDHERDGRQIRAGDRVFLVLQSANRDEGTFAGPDRFDIERPAKPLHVGFGRGGARLPGRAAGADRGPGRAAEDPGPARGHPHPRRRHLAAEHRVSRRHRAADRLRLRL
jgi:hypothetical protein